MHRSFCGKHTTILRTGIRLVHSAQILYTITCRNMENCLACASCWLTLYYIHENLDTAWEKMEKTASSFWFRLRLVLRLFKRWLRSLVLSGLIIFGHQKTRCFLTSNTLYLIVSDTSTIAYTCFGVFYLSYGVSVSSRSTLAPFFKAELYICSSWKGQFIN